MATSRIGLWAALLTSLLAMPASVEAGPLLKGKWSPHQPTSYSSLHYWAPSLYYWKAQHHPVNYHQYAPGPSTTFTVDAPANPPAPPKEVLPPPQPAGNGK